MIKPDHDPFLDPVSLQVLDIIPAFVMISATDGRVEFFNAAWYQFTGQTTGSIDDGAWRESIYPGDAERVATAWYEAVARGDRVVRMRYRVRHAATGEYRWITARAEAIFATDGTVRHWLGIGSEEDRRVSERAVRREQSGRRERKRQRAIEGIQRVAIRLFLERGFESVSVAELARAAYVSPASIFRHFVTKSEIVLSVIRDPVETICDGALSVPPDRHRVGPLRAALRDFCRQLAASSVHGDAERVISQTPALFVEAARQCGEACGALAQRLHSARRFDDHLDASAMASALLWPWFMARQLWAADARRDFVSVLDEAHRILDDAGQRNQQQQRNESDRRPMPIADAPPEASSDRARRARSDLTRIATRLVTQRGLAATSIDDIVSEADVSRRTFFRYFNSKEDAVLGDAWRHGDLLYELAILRPAVERPLEVAKEAYRSFAVACYEQPAADLLMLLNVIHHEDLTAQRVRLRLHNIQRLAAALARRMVLSEDDLAPLVLAGTVVMCGSDAIDRWIQTQGRESIATAIDAALTALDRILDHTAR